MERSSDQTMRRNSIRIGTVILMVLLVGAALLSVRACTQAGGIQQGKHTGAWYDIHMIDANNGWASTYRSILHTTDGGAHWQDVTPWHTFGRWGHSGTFVSASVAWVVQQGDKDNKSSAQAFATSDGGKTWHTADLPDTISKFTITTGTNVERLDVSVSKIFAYDGQHGLVIATEVYTPAHNSDDQTTEFVHVLQTDDGGQRWHLLLDHLPDANPSSTNPFGIGTWATFLDKQTGWIAGISTPVYVTHDGGQSWQPQVLPPLPASHFNGGVAYEAPQFFDARNGILPIKLYTNVQSAYGAYITTDGGATWAAPSLLTITGFPVISYLDQQRWFMMTDDKLYKTSDGGQRWTTTPIHTGYLHVTGVDFLSDTVGWIIGNNTSQNSGFTGDSDTITALLKTTDGGATWHVISHSVS